MMVLRILPVFPVYPMDIKEQPKQNEYSVKKKEEKTFESTLEHELAKLTGAKIVVRV